MTTSSTSNRGLPLLAGLGVAVAVLVVGLMLIQPAPLPAAAKGSAKSATRPATAHEGRRQCKDLQVADSE